MRGCLSVLILAAGFVLAAAWFAGPPLAGVLVERSLTGAGMVADEASVTVSTDPPLELIAGHADTVVIRATRATLRDLAADRLVLTFGDVDLVERRFDRIDGELGGVVFHAADGATIQARSLRVRGPAATATVTVEINGGVLDAMLRDAIRRQTGLAVAAVVLSEPDRVRFTLGVFETESRLEVTTDGSLAIAIAGTGVRFRVFDPRPRIHLTTVSVRGSDLVLTGTSDVTDLLR